jgi:ribosomal protein S18 acetylase RimI-like enzyme
MSRRFPFLLIANVLVSSFKYVLDDLKSDLKIKKAQSDDIQEIYKVLSQAFNPYRQYYTEGAYRATVISPHEIEKRITEKETDVLVAICNSKIVGTASIEVQEGNVHVCSMAVKPHHQGKSVGWRVLQEINELAKKRHCKTITLECFEPLTKAVSLYEKFGLKRTGRRRNLYGIIVFEMMKRVKI